MVAIAVMSLCSAEFSYARLERTLRRASLLLRLSMVAVFVVGAFAAVAAAPSGMLGSASATCKGAGNPESIADAHGGHQVAIERPVDGTCNSDGTYRGTIADTHTDGKCALVRFKDGGRDPWTHQTDCSANNGGVTFTFNDVDGDHQAEIKVCIEGACSNADARWRVIRGY